MKDENPSPQPQIINQVYVSSQSTAVAQAHSSSGPPVAGCLGCLAILALGAIAWCGGCMFMADAVVQSSTATNSAAPKPPRPQKRAAPAIPQNLNATADMPSIEVSSGTQTAAIDPQVSESPLVDPVPEKFGRQWTSANGNYTVDAEFVTAIAGKVRLRTENGELKTIPIEQLSPVDQEWIRELARRKGT